METSELTDVTRLLLEAADGDSSALERLVPIVYSELRHIAHRRLGGERVDHTLSTTALVHEAYLKLVGLERLTWQNREQFMAIVSRLMRQVLVDYARRRRADRRGGGRPSIDLGAVAEHVPGESDVRTLEVLALDDALERLEHINARHARIVECRFFAGMSIEETAEALSLSPATVKRDWIMARAWLNRELSA